MNKLIKATLTVELQAKAGGQQVIIDSFKKTIHTSLKEEDLVAIKSQVMLQKISYEEALTNFLKKRLHNDSSIDSLEEKYSRLYPRYGKLYIDIIPVSKIIWGNGYIPQYPVYYWLNCIKFYKKLFINSLNKFLTPKIIGKFFIILILILFIIILFFVPTYPLNVFLH